MTLFLVQTDLTEFWSIKNKNAVKTESHWNCILSAVFLKRSKYVPRLLIASDWKD